MSGAKQKRSYNKEFKKEAIRLVIEEGYKAAEVERNLGIGSNIVSHWVSEAKDDPEHAFPAEGILNLQMRSSEP
jgi:transposase